MTPTTHASSPEMGAKIRVRRNELSLTIEDAARAAKVGSETWRRYEAGSAIRSDKYRGVCRALRWPNLPSIDGSESEAPNFPGFWFSSVAAEAYSTALADSMGEACARTFAVGFDIFTDELHAVARDLASMPRGSHMGELGGTMLDGDFPERWLTRYDYEFIYHMLSQAELLRMRIQYPAFDGIAALTRCVADQLAVHLILGRGALAFGMSDVDDPDIQAEIEAGHPEWTDDLNNDDEIIHTLFANWGFPVSSSSDLHFERWFDEPEFEVDEPDQDEVDARVRTAISKLWKSKPSLPESTDKDAS